MDNPIACQIGNYHYAGPEHLFERKVLKETFIIGFATAYNAFGLVGSEKNGIFVLNKTKHDVVLDEHMRVGSGWYGPNAHHLAELQKLKAMPAAELIGWIAGHPRARDQYRA
jgi:hypothetical protein